MNLEGYHLPARKRKIRMLARRPREPVPMLHAAQADAEGRRGILKHVGMRAFEELGDGNRRGRGNLHTTIGCVKGDRIGGFWLRVPWNFRFAEKVQTTASVHKPPDRTTNASRALNRRHGKTRTPRTEVLAHLGPKLLSSPDGVSGSNSASGVWGTQLFLVRAPAGGA